MRWGDGSPPARAFDGSALSTLLFSLRRFELNGALYQCSVSLSSVLGVARGHAHGWWHGHGHCAYVFIKTHRGFKKGTRLVERDGARRRQVRFVAPVVWPKLGLALSHAVGSRDGVAALDPRHDRLHSSRDTHTDWAPERRPAGQAGGGQCELGASSRGGAQPSAAAAGIGRGEAERRAASDPRAGRAASARARAAHCHEPPSRRPSLQCARGTTGASGCAAAAGRCAEERQGRAAEAAIANRLPTHTASTTTLTAASLTTAPLTATHPTRQGAPTASALAAAALTAATLAAAVATTSVTTTLAAASLATASVTAPRAATLAAAALAATPPT